jgi:hypothetical protein
MYNFISSHLVSREFKKSKYYTVNLGKTMSVKKNNRRVFRLDEGDSFNKSYLEKYNAVAYSEGNIGKINFHVDHYLSVNEIRIFFKDEIYEFEHNALELKSKGVDSYIGNFIKEIETKLHQEELETREVEIVDILEGNSENIFNNPGNVSYTDIQKYYDDLKKKKL